MKKIAYLVIFVVLMLFSFNTASAGIFSKAEASVPKDTMKKLEKTAKEAVARRIEYNTRTHYGVKADIEIKKLRITETPNKRDLSGFIVWFVQGEVTFTYRVTGIVDAKLNQAQPTPYKIGDKFDSQLSFRCELPENGYKDIYFRDLADVNIF